MLTQNRKNERNQTERRVQDRRQVDYLFGSAEWLQYVQQVYAAWPKAERRTTFRRDGERRQSRASESLSKNANNDYTSELLTKEEITFFNALFLKNND